MLRTQCLMRSYAHYVEWVLNGKNTSHFQLLQKPLILDVCKPQKKIRNFLSGTHKIFIFTRFEIAWTGRINLKFFGGIWHQICKHLSFYGLSLFPNRKSIKSDIYPIFLAKEDKCHFWDLFSWKIRITHKCSNA